MSEEATVTLIKGGEMCIEAILHRSPAGLTINVQAHPQVEDFVRNMGDGSLIDIRSLGRHWVPANGEKNGNRRNPPGNQGPLMIYMMSTNPGIIPMDDGTAFRIDKPGWQLSNPMDEPVDDGGLRPTGRNNPFAAVQYKNVINLSFIRLAGISEGAGVKFGVDGVHTDEGVDRLAISIQKACAKFYKRYMKSITEVVTVSRQEIPS